MKRRSFLKQAAAGLAAGTVAAPAIAQSSPTIQWRLAASWPKSLDTLFGGAELVAKRVAEITDGKFQIRAFAAGEIVPALQVLDAVGAGTVELGHTAPYYYFGKDPAFAFGTAVLRHEYTAADRVVDARRRPEAMALLRKEHGCVALLAGNTGCQMGGWWRKEIKTVAEGGSRRIGGMVGSHGQARRHPAAARSPDIYPALRRAPSTPRNGSVRRRREAGLQQGRCSITTQASGRRLMLMTLVNEKKWNERPCSTRPPRGLWRDQLLDAGGTTPRTPAPPPDCERYATAAVPAR
jgi:hypothetical protein